MKIMSVDIGTNSTLHLVVDVTDNEIILLERGIIGNSLGAEISPDSVINELLMEKNQLILRTLVKKAHELGCVRIGAVGTHALRKAVNRDEFIKMAEGEGINLKIISDADEANLAWKGVFGSNGPTKRTALLDLGGGSIELILGKGETREYSDSIPMGAVTLTRDHFKHDPPLYNETLSAKAAACDVFRKWKPFQERSFDLIGIAGTITALATIKYRIVEYTPDCLNGLTLNPEDVSKLTGRLLSMNLSEREAMPGMPTARAASIHAGALMLDIILDVIGRRSITVSERGILFGLADEIADVA
ncbi:MAG: hypothetical protein HQ568_11960 [Calditrichaeota bacterium]|nr:hypothetical protein [Calditrichota bacterium]